MHCSLPCSLLRSPWCSLAYRLFSPLATLRPLALLLTPPPPPNLSFPFSLLFHSRTCQHRACQFVVKIRTLPLSRVLPRTQHNIWSLQHHRYVAQTVTSLASGKERSWQLQVLPTPTNSTLGTVLDRTVSPPAKSRRLSPPRSTKTEADSSFEGNSVGISHDRHVKCERVSGKLSVKNEGAMATSMLTEDEQLQLALEQSRASSSSSIEKAPNDLAGLSEEELVQLAIKESAMMVEHHRANLPTPSNSPRDVHQMSEEEQLKLVLEQSRRDSPDWARAHSDAGPSPWRDSGKSAGQSSTPTRPSLKRELDSSRRSLVDQVSMCCVVRM